MDLIERQAAIDYCYQLINVEHEQGSDEMNYSQERVNQTETILHHLEFMPSAQPDIIRCRNCKFASGDSRICMKFGHSPIGELDFCTWAERRTDEE